MREGHFLFYSVRVLNSMSAESLGMSILLYGWTERGKSFLL